MTFTIWYLIIGGLLILMALAGSVVKRLPLTTSILYLAAGIGLGPLGFGLIRWDAIEQSALLERVTEVVVVISLFTAGLKLRAPLSNERWLGPLRLAFISMALTVGMIALLGHLALGLSLGAAILLGAILAPTDPVLASDVQLEHPWDRDRLRFSLTGEAGLNDGSAFPFVMLGLGLLGLHELGAFGWRWVAVDVIWAIGGGIAIGGLLGMLIGYLVLYLRRTHKEAIGLDDFLALGLIALAYGVALLAHTYGFLAVFAAGVALRRIERHSSGEAPPDEIQVIAATREGQDNATDEAKAPAYMAQTVLGYTEQLERIGEMGIVLVVGGLLATYFSPNVALWFVPALFLLIRPTSVALGLIGARESGQQQALLAWFGIRGIGSIYYLMYSIQHGLSSELSEQLTTITLTVVAISIFVHGFSVTPLMSRYQARGQ